MLAPSMIGGLVFPPNALSPAPPSSFLLLVVTHRGPLPREITEEAIVVVSGATAGWANSTSLNLQEDADEPVSRSQLEGNPVTERPPPVTASSRERRQQLDASGAVGETNTTTPSGTALLFAAAPIFLDTDGPLRTLAARTPLGQTSSAPWTQIFQPLRRRLVSRTTEAQRGVTMLVFLVAVGIVWPMVEIFSFWKISFSMGTSTPAVIGK